MEYFLNRRNFIRIIAAGGTVFFTSCGKKETEIMLLRPHHLLDIVNDYGHDVEFTPHPFGHAVHIVAGKVLADMDMKVEFIAGADEICKPCMHLQADGMCADSLYQVTPHIAKQTYNDRLDNRLFSYFGFAPGTVMTVGEYLKMVNGKVPGIEIICMHPGEEQDTRLDGLTKGLVKLGIRAETA